MNQPAVVIHGGSGYPAYLIDETTLREELLSTEEAREWCAEHRGDPMRVSYLRMLGDTEAALECGERSLMKREPGTVTWAAAAARLAAVHHWRGEFDEAYELLDAAEEVAHSEDHDNLLGLVQQHRAKALLDQERYEEASAAAQEAYRIRSRAGNKALLESTRQVMAAIAQHWP